MYIRPEERRAHNALLREVHTRVLAEEAARDDVITKRGRGRPAGSTNKPITPTNMERRSSKAKNPETEGFV